ncbi:MAG: NAD(P)-binding protein [Bacillota bacterium]
MSKLRVNIDGIEVLGYKGQTILQLAMENEIEIPNLCYDNRLNVYGSCGLCVVEVEGVPKLLRACATEISDNMVVRTRSKRIDQSRKTTLELMLANHTGDCKAPCQLACPAETDCQGYVGLIANGEYEEAVALIKDKLPLPASIGRVCPHPCEDACRRNFVDKPVAIAALKRFVGDIVLEKGSSLKADIKPPTGKKVAVIGGGPSGLTCAYFLAREGHEAVVYEAMPKAGGMLRYGIPQYRLPKDVLDMEIDIIKETGVQINAGIKIGKDLSLDYLRENYDAVYIAIGAWQSTGIRCKGEDLDGVMGGIDFLIKVAQKKPVKLGERVAVIGGGNTAMDSARTAVRLGAKKVIIIYRRTEQEMPAEELEIREAREEGVEFNFLLAPIEIIDSNGHISEIRCQKMKLGEPDASGRRRPVPVEGEEVTLDVDTVIAAIGQRVDASGLEEIDLAKKGTIQYNECTFQTSIEGVFAGGDSAAGPGIAIEAIAQGKKAAGAICGYLEGRIVPVSERFYVKQEDLTEEDFKDKEVKPRVDFKVMEPAARKQNFLEVADSYTEEEAKTEAKRCMECGCGDVFDCKLLVYANQYNVERDKFAGVKTETDVDDKHPFIDRNPDKCVLCGLCVRTCSEVTGITALCVAERGFDTVVKTPFGMQLKDTDCISCGQCVSVCPVGALQERLSIEKSVPVEQKTTQSVCSYCSMGCNIDLTTRGSMVMRSLPNRESAVDNGLLCVKGRFGFDYVQRKDRLIKPMIRVKGTLKESAFEEAFTYAAKQINNIRSVYGNESVAVLSSARLTNEESFTIAKLAKDTLNTPNLANSSNGCDTGIQDVLGYNASTNTFDELNSTELILYVGGESYENHPVMGMKLLAATKAGAKLVTISPERIKAGVWANLEICGEDNLTLVKGILKYTMDSGSISQKLIDTKTNGYQELKAALAYVTPSDTAVKAADLYCGAKKAIIVIDETSVSREAAKALADLAVITGKIGSPRSGIILLKALNNSQGAYDMGIEKSTSHMDWSGVKAVITFGEAVPEEVSGNLELLIASDLFMSETTEKADVVFPAASFAESSGTYTNTERRVQRVTTLFAPKSGMSNLSVATGLAGALGDKFSSQPDQVLKEIKTSIKEYSCIDADSISQGKAFWAMDKIRILYAGGFGFEDKKARLVIPGNGKTFRKARVLDSIEKHFEDKMAEAGLK